MKKKISYKLLSGQRKQYDGYIMKSDEINNKILRAKSKTADDDNLTEVVRKLKCTRCVDCHA